MPRMFVEHKFPRSVSTRDALAQLMARLDEAAAMDGHRVDGDVTIMEYESPIALTRDLRIEADVVPSV